MLKRNHLQIIQFFIFFYLEDVELFKLSILTDPSRSNFLLFKKKIQYFHILHDSKIISLPIVLYVGVIYTYYIFIKHNHFT